MQTTAKKTYRSIAAGIVQGLGARENQQDSYGVDASGRSSVLAIVADGMGGLVNSDQVSRRIVDAMLDAYAPDGEIPARHQLLLLLKRAIEEAAAVTADSRYDSGSTLAACIAGPSGLSWISVGDSRVCLWRKGSLIQLSRDHDFAHELAVMALSGSYTLEEADVNPRRDALTSYIGKDFPKYVDFNPQPITLQKGDRVILMSDGVYRALSQQELCRCLAKGAAKSAKQIERMIQKKHLPQQDNFTAVILTLR